MGGAASLFSPPKPTRPPLPQPRPVTQGIDANVSAARDRERAAALQNTQGRSGNIGAGTSMLPAALGYKELLGM